MSKTGPFKKIFAILNLAYHFILHFLKKPFLFRHEGLKTFFNHYQKDGGMLPLTSQNTQLLRRLSACIGCGFCDTACPALLKTPREKFPGPSFIANSYTRSFNDLWAAKLDTSTSLSTSFSICSECGECEKVCPNGVPIQEGILFIQEKLNFPLP